MADIPSTRASLLVRLRDRLDQDAWREFVRLYAPVVYRFARRRGLQDADAADLTQEVLRSVAGSVAAFDPSKGLFRGWLFTLVHRRLYDLQQTRQRQPVGAGDQATQQLLDETPARDDEDFWHREYERQLFTLAAERIRPIFNDTTWQAFQLAAVDGQSGQDVAKTLGISVAAVYLAKSRVMVKLKAEIARMNAE
jgi:RNA polymerase sigma-70 factor (ECF subfamily)